MPSVDSTASSITGPASCLDSTAPPVDAEEIALLVADHDLQFRPRRNLSSAHQIPATLLVHADIPVPVAALAYLHIPSSPAHISSLLHITSLQPSLAFTPRNLGPPLVSPGLTLISLDLHSSLAPSTR